MVQIEEHEEVVVESETVKAETSAKGVFPFFSPLFHYLRSIAVLFASNSLINDVSIISCVLIRLSSFK